MLKHYVFAGVTALAIACGGSRDSATTAEAAAPVVIPLMVFSGRENPPPETTAVRAGTEVVLHVQGLGPARARVLAPDGTETPTRDAPYQENGQNVGTEQRFVPSAHGQWRIEIAGAQGVVLAYLSVS